MTRGPRGTDPVLLVEALLALVFFALVVFLFLLPAARPPFAPRWWTWLVVAAVFFSLVGLDAWRRKRNRTREIHRPHRPVEHDPARPDKTVPPAV